MASYLNKQPSSSYIQEIGGSISGDNNSSALGFVDTVRLKEEFERVPLTHGNRIDVNNESSVVLSTDQEVHHISSR